MSDQPRRYRKHPVVIEAIRYLPTSNCAAVAAFLGDDDAPCVGHEFNPGHAEALWTIPTLEGAMEANPGDYIIKGVAGEFYPCKPDIFEATYEPVGCDE